MKKIRTYLKTWRIPMLMAMTAMTIITTACQDEIEESENNAQNERAISFVIKNAEDAINTPNGLKMMASSAQGLKAMLATQDLKPSDITASYTPMEVPGKGTMFLSSATFPTIEEKTKEMGTRAEISENIYDEFYTIGFKGNNPNYTLQTPWFYKIETSHKGKLKETKYWDLENPYADFYAIAAQNKSNQASAKTEEGQLQVSGQDHTGTPYIDFTVNTNAKEQVDLLTAYSGRQQYTVENPPKPKLYFFHALTAVKFNIGPNLSWNKTVTKVEILGAKSKGRFTLSNDKDKNGTWSDQTDPANFILETNKSTNGKKGDLLLGQDGTNTTFYMLPQKLENIKFVFTCDDGTVIRLTPRGEWKAGTTKTYSISQNKSDWVYVMNSSNPQIINWNQDKSGEYAIWSYRVYVENKNDTVRNSIQPVPWKIAGYEYDGKESQTKPDWLAKLHLTQDEGSYRQKLSFAQINNQGYDANWLESRNNTLKNAQPLGSEGSPYDLSTYGGTKPRTTANCYVVSAQGWYCLPLVYGNAITNDNTNENAYISKLPKDGNNILTHFLDHAGNPITNPWITKSNGGAYKPDGASLVWADTQGIIDESTLKVVDINGEKYLKFRILPTLSNGNAVVAVKQGNTVLWSWQLWVAPQEVLTTIPNQNQKGDLLYDVAYETLGYKYTEWHGTKYKTPRTVKVILKQDDGNKKDLQTTTVTLTQLPGFTSKGYSTLYQFGRKDAFPGIETIPVKNENIKFALLPNEQKAALYATTQNPGTFYLNNYNNGWADESPWKWQRHYFNIWSANSRALATKNQTYITEDNVKTVYDPCPAGFKVPTGDAFSGFIYPYDKRKPKPENSGVKVSANGNGEDFIRNASPWQEGYFFYNKNENPDQVLWFPLTTHREGGTWWNDHSVPAGHVVNKDHGGKWARYWNCNVGIDNGKEQSWGGQYLDFSGGWVGSADKNWFETGQAIRPVKDAPAVRTGK